MPGTAVPIGLHRRVLTGAGGRQVSVFNAVPLRGGVEQFHRRHTLGSERSVDGRGKRVANRHGDAVCNLRLARVFERDREKRRGQTGIFIVGGNKGVKRRQRRLTGEGCVAKSHAGNRKFPVEFTFTEMGKGAHRVADASNENARKTWISCYICPSDRKGERTFVLADSKLLEHEDEDDHDHVEEDHEHHTDENAVFATSNYVCSLGTTNVHDAESFGHAGTLAGKEFKSNGAFYHNSHLGMDAFLDGLSNTIFVGERAVEKVHYSTWVGMPAGDGCIPAIVCGTTHDGFNNSGEHHSYSSWHPNGSNFLLGDGSVRFIPSTIQTEKIQALTTREGGETVSL